MGLSLSLLYSAWEEIVANWCYRLVPFSSSFSKQVKLNLGAKTLKRTDSGILMTNPIASKNSESKNSINFQNCKPKNVALDRSFSLKHMLEDQEKQPTRPVSDNKKVRLDNKKGLELSLPVLDPEIFFSPRLISELQEASVKIQKHYKGHRTRRNLADCAVVIEELWWKAIDSAALSHSSVSFYKNDKPETVASRWMRARKRVSQFARGLSKDDMAQKLALQHWLEAIDPRHRYGHNLHLYYDKWFQSESSEPFFYWLDIGQGKDVVHEKCPRSPLYRQCIKYLGPKEREAYEVIIERGKLIYKQSRDPVNTDVGSKWIFVLSTSRLLYVGQKKKGSFQHSSFLAGAATTSAGRLVAHGGVLEAIWPYSGHYHPTEENFRQFISFLEDHHVDLSNVKRCSIDDDNPSYINPGGESKHGSLVGPSESKRSNNGNDVTSSTTGAEPVAVTEEEDKVNGPNRGEENPKFEFGLPRTRSTGAGHCISIVRDYPTQLQCQALEQVNLSPRVGPGPAAYCGRPIPSPRPSPKFRVSPKLTYMGHPSPRTPKVSAY